MTRFLNSLLLIFLILRASGQSSDHIDPNYFDAPVKIPIFLAGNFAELRPNHFHGGIDIKTQGRTGISVYAAAEGYISRIVLSPTGYGRALYINHPNGTTTVYGHLQSFVKPIDDYIRTIQYEKETFAIDQAVPEGMLPVKKGGLIAKSGNAGSSAGPHLHFEIRRTKEEVMLNPLLFHLPVNDKTKPSIQALMVYPLSDDACVSGKQSPQRFYVIPGAKGYQLKVNQTIPVFGKIGFGVKTVDLLDGSPNKCAIYSIRLLVDKKLIYSFKMDEVAIVQSKYVNSHMDYSYAVRSGQRLYRTWLEPGNKLNVYDAVVERGILTETDEQIHHVTYEISDVYGNSTSLSFAIQSREMPVKQVVHPGEKFRYDRNNEIDDDGIDFSVPEGALYSDVDFIYEKKTNLSRYYAPVFRLHDPSVALHVACPLRIKADGLPERFQGKAMLAQIDPVSGRILSATGNFEHGWVVGNVRVLGNYTVVVDTVAPKIISISIAEKKLLKDVNGLRFKVTDNLSGIEKYRGTIDGKWVLFEYDLKNNLISYSFDKIRMEFGKSHELVFEVVDYKGNSSTYKAKFYK
ncbi:MAG: M23 family metallopeptidase [Prolixibacteraceae bacterium]|jgi:hypothetical protein